MHLPQKEVTHPPISARSKQNNTKHGFRRLCSHKSAWVLPPRHDCRQTTSTASQLLLFCSHKPQQHLTFWWHLHENAKSRNATQINASESYSDKIQESQDLLLNHTPVQPLFLTMLCAADHDGSERWPKNVTTCARGFKWIGVQNLFKNILKQSPGECVRGSVQNIQTYIHVRVKTCQSSWLWHCAVLPALVGLNPHSTISAQGVDCLCKESNLQEDHLEHCTTLPNCHMQVITQHGFCRQM